ncbi:MAG: T9SS type A sorting domain-containing protein [Saprospiraceae bacterium]
MLDGTGISPGTSSETFYDELDEKPANDHVYRFTPPGGGGCTAPTAYNLTGGGLYCPGSPVAFGLSSSESGVTYQLVRNGSDIGSPVGGTGNWGLAKKLVADDGAANNFFGNSVAQAGDIAVVGANGNSNNRGAAYIFAQDFGGSGNWGQAKKLMAGDPAIGDGFGTSVSVSGDFVLVGAPNKGTYMGAAYIFQRDAGGTDNWGQVKKLQATDCATNDRFGTNVVLDGDYACVSAVRCGGSGAMYIFHRNAGGADNWGQLAKHTPSDGAANDQFGSALAVSGFNFAASSSLDDVSGKTDQGSVYVFEGHDCGDEDRPEQTTTAAHSPVVAAMPSVVCSPNPFRDALTVQIGAVGAVRLQITDATGRIIEQAELPAGTARFDWQAIGQPTGLYFVQVAAEGGVQVVPVSLMR